MEIWKDIKDYEGLYQVSNLGRVRNIRHNKNKILKPIYHKKYYQITLSKNNIRVQYRIHRLVATAFIPNPENLPEVNHKDENKVNNCVSNLEWCDSKYNNNYNNKGKRISKAKMGHTTSKETRIKISNTLKEYYKRKKREA